MPIGRLLRRCAPGLVALAAALCCAVPARAQGWLPTPVTFVNGRITLGGELTATYGSDDPGFFNYTDYDTSAFRRIRAGLTVALTPTSRVALLAEGRVESGGGVNAYAYFARLTPWPGRPVAIQVGRVPPVFGMFARRGYPQDNPLVGDPLAFQYLTSVRDDAVPATTADLLRMRGRGWRVAYPAGATNAAPGLAIVSAFNWDTGVQLRAGRRPLELNASWTLGSLSTPEHRDVRGRGAVAARVAIMPSPGLTLGMSAARGTFLTDAARRAFSAQPQGGTQTALGLDGAFTAGHLVLRGEMIGNTWSVPMAAGVGQLGVLAGYLEARYRVSPRVYLAARIERLAFDDIAAGGGRQPWEADVARAEAGGGYSLARHVSIKVTYQYDRRDGGRVRRSHLGAAQLVVWF